ncbi:rab3 GTPase-activating protein catalytic subunit isoform X2 [Photinus pyralis]|nr:rab3 GTPase-activating protein catalytic subunit isoform X2 [Photinus pyralis]XP_031344514.1 rab3 GTPase-activating protein catalytic subunit isoform X2 [Photinus pyralis]
MLNCCIERKRSREMRETEPSVSKYVDANSSTDDEEFYDCTSDKVEEEDTRRKTKHALWNQPVGRLGKFENLKLIKLGDPLYIPITQDPVPKTEDQLQEDTDILLQLGSDAQGSELRAKMMSASLLSDMESFKAANPGSILEDFIRWYSPRDWIEKDGLDQWGQKMGHLSARMLIADNPWVQMWQSAKPVPANRQKRLFDDTREAEKVLHFLDSRTFAQIIEMLFPILAHAAICRLYDECEQVSPVLPSAHKSLQQAIRLVQKISRDDQITERLCGALIQQIAALELAISQANSLLYKFNPAGGCDETVYVFTEKLLNGCEVEIEDASKSNIGSRLTSMFTEAQRLANMILTEHSGGSAENNSTGNIIFPQANEREFVMRVAAVRPASYSKKSPQFLRAILSKSEFRLAGAFSEDIVYF